MQNEMYFFMGVFCSLFFFFFFFKLYYGIKNDIVHVQCMCQMDVVVHVFLQHSVSVV